MSARRVSLKGHRNVYFRQVGRQRFYEIGYRDSTGRQRWERVNGDMQAALARRDEILGRKRQGQRVEPTRMTLAETVEAWREDRSYTRLRPRTRVMYDGALRLHVLPRLGRKPLTKITDADIASVVSEMEAQGLSGWTISNAMTPLSRVLAFAAHRRRGWIAFNPMANLERDDKPSKLKREMRILDSEEIQRFLAAAPKTYLPVLATAVFTGLRQSELLGLRWGDIDFDGGHVNVRGQLSHGREFVEAGKTEAARRSVVLMPALAKLLREHRAASRFSKDSDFVFATATGLPPLHRNVSRRGFEVAAIAAGINPPKPKKGEEPVPTDGRPRLRFHDTRHSFASILITQGRDVTYVASQLGHSKPSVTLDVYAHLFDRERHADETRAALEARYGSVLEAAVQSDEVPAVPADPGNVVFMRVRG